MKKIFPFSMKPVCLLLVGVLILSDCRPLLALMPLTEQSNPASPGVSNSFTDLSRLQVPAEIGTIEEVFQGRGQETRDKRQKTRNKGQTNLHAPRPSSPAPFVVLIQDAHAIPDAQRNIQKLIEYFQKEYGAGLVALEGASSELDPQVFKSFPDKEILKKTLNDYFERGELTGATAASIISEKHAVYQGIEDWKLYEEGLRLYLEAMGSESKLLEKLQAARRRLQEEKEKIYSKELLELDKTLEAFKRNDLDLMAVVKQLKQVADKGTGREALPVPLSIQALLEEIQKEGKDQSAIEREVREIAEEVKKHLLQAASRKPQDNEDPAVWSLKLAAFNQTYQEFQTSQITPEAFALFLKEFAEKGTGREILPVPFSVRLTRLMSNHKHLRDIQGTQFFRDFETFVKSVKESLFQNEEEHKLDAESRKLDLLEKLAKLELSPEEWEEIKTRDYRPETRDQVQAGIQDDSLWEPHFGFYKNAENRDKAFFRNLLKLMEQPKSLVSSSRSLVWNASLLIAGGFHTQGLARQFKENGISYVIVQPQINKLPNSPNYQSLMRGKVSWEKYFIVENGKVDLHEAFVRGARDRLLRGQETRDKGQELSFPVSPVSRPLLKAWRDEILRNLAASEKLTQAGEYTQFLDEITYDLRPQTQDIMRLQWFSRIKAFTKGLRGLEVKGQLTEPNILKLLRPSTVLQAVAGNASAVRHSLFPAELLQSGVERSVRGESGRSPDSQYGPEQSRRAEVRADREKSENRVILVIKVADRQGVSVDSEAIEALAERREEGERLSSAERMLIDSYQTVKDHKTFPDWNSALVKAGILSEAVEAEMSSKPEKPSALAEEPARPAKQEEAPQLVQPLQPEQTANVERPLPAVKKRKPRIAKVPSEFVPKKEPKKPVRAEGKWNKDKLIELVQKAIALGIPRNPGQVQRARKIDYGDEEKNRVARELGRGYNMLANGNIKGVEGPGKWKQILDAAGDEEGVKYQGGQVARDVQWTEAGVLDFIKEAHQAVQKPEDLKLLSSATITDHQEQLKEVFGQELAKKITGAYYAVRDERVVIEGVPGEHKWRAALVKAGLSIEQVYDRSWRRRSVRGESGLSPDSQYSPEQPRRAEVRLSDEDKAKAKELVRQAAALIDGADMHGRARGLLPPLDGIDYLIDHIGEPVDGVDIRLLGIKGFTESSLEAIEKVLARLDVFNPGRKELEQARRLLTPRSELRGKHRKERTAAAMDAYIESGSWLQKAESAYARGLSRNPQIRLAEIEGIMKDLRIAHDRSKQGKAAPHNLAQIITFQGLMLLKQGNAYVLLEKADETEKSYEDAAEKSYKDAVKMLTRALALNPFDKLASDQKGFALQALGAFYLDHVTGADTLKEENPAKVRKLLEQSIEKSSKALSYLSENEKKEAEEKIQEARQLLAQVSRSEVREDARDPALRKLKAAAAITASLLIFDLYNLAFTRIFPAHDDARTLIINAIGFFLWSLFSLERLARKNTEDNLPDRLNPQSVRMLLVVLPAFTFSVNTLTAYFFPGAGAVYFHPSFLSPAVRLSLLGIFQSAWFFLWVAARSLRGVSFGMIAYMTGGLSNIAENYFFKGAHNFIPLFSGYANPADFLMAAGLGLLALDYASSFFKIPLGRAKAIDKTIQRLKEQFDFSEAGEYVIREYLSGMKPLDEVLDFIVGEFNTPRPVAIQYLKTAKEVFDSESFSSTRSEVRPNANALGAQDDFGTGRSEVRGYPENIEKIAIQLSRQLDAWHLEQIHGYAFKLSQAASENRSVVLDDDESLVDFVLRERILPRANWHFPNEKEYADFVKLLSQFLMEREIVLQLRAMVTDPKTISEKELIQNLAIVAGGALFAGAEEISLRRKMLYRIAESDFSRLKKFLADLQTAPSRYAGFIPHGIRQSDIERVLQIIIQASRSETRSGSNVQIEYLQAKKDQKEAAKTAALIELPWWGKRWEEINFTDHLRSAGGVIYMSKENNQIASFMSLTESSKGVYLHNFAIHPDYDDNQEFLKAMFARLKRNSGSRPISTLVRESRLDIQRSFKSQGFRWKETWTKYFPDTGEDAYEMVFEPPFAPSGRRSEVRTISKPVPVEGFGENPAYLLKIIFEELKDLSLPLTQALQESHDQTISFERTEGFRNRFEHVRSLYSALIEVLGEENERVKTLDYALQMTNLKIHRLESRAEVRSDHEDKIPPLSAQQKQKVVELADKLLSGHFAEELEKGDQRELLQFLKAIYDEKIKSRWKIEIEWAIRMLEANHLLKPWQVKRLVRIFGRILKLEKFLKDQVSRDHAVMMKPEMLHNPDFTDQLFFSEQSPLDPWEKRLLDMRYAFVDFVEPVSLGDIAKDDIIAQGRGKPYVNPYVEIPQDIRKIENKAASFYKSYRLRSEVRLASDKPSAAPGVRLSAARSELRGKNKTLAEDDFDEVITFEFQPEIAESLSLLKRTAYLEANYHYEDIDDLDTFKERFPDIWTLLNGISHSDQIFPAVGELIYNALEASKESKDPVRVEIGLFEDPTVAQNKKAQMLRMMIFQPLSTEDSWKRLQINKQQFDAEGSDYLTDLARRLREGARKNFGNGLSRAGYLLQAFPVMLRYQRSKDSALLPLTTEFYIDLSKTFPSQYLGTERSVPRGAVERTGPEDGPEQSRRAELRESDRETGATKTIRLVQIVQKGNVSDSVLAMHELLRMHKGLYFRMANKYRWALDRSRVMSRDDLLEAAKQGFMFGVYKFDSRGGAAFSTVVVRYILNEIHEEINSHGVSISSQFLDQPWLFSMYPEAYATLKQRGEIPRLKDLAQEIESLIKKDLNEERRETRLEVFRSRINLEDLVKAMEARARKWVSASQLSPDDKGKERSPFASMAGNSDLIGLHLSLEFKEWLEKIKPLLTEKEFGIVMHRLTAEVPQRDLNGKERELENEAIAQSLGIAPEQVEGFEDIALQKLKRAIGQWMTDGTLDENDIRDKSLRNYFLEKSLTAQEEVSSWAKDPATGFLNIEMLLGYKIVTKGRMVTFIEFLNQLDQEGLSEYLDLLPDRAKKVIETILENPVFTQTELAKQQGVSHQAIDQYFGLAFGKAVILANARQDGASSFAGLVWEISKIIPPSRTVELLTRLKITERDALLKITSEQLRSVFSPKIYSLYEQKLFGFLGSQRDLRVKRYELSKPGRFGVSHLSFARTEIRKVSPLVTKSILYPERVKGSDYQAATHEVFLLVKALKVSGFIKALNRSVRDRLKQRSELRLAPEPSGIDIKTYRRASNTLIYTLRAAARDFPEQRYTVGFLLPEKDPGYGSESVTRHYIEALGASIDTVVVAGKVTSALSHQLKMAGKHIRPLPNLKQPVMVPGQPAVPLGIVEPSQRSEVRAPVMHEAFIPIAIDLERIEDPFVKDYARKLQAVALVHTAEILGEMPDLLKNRSLLRSELRKRLAISGEYDSMITLDQKQGWLGFTISGTLAQAFLRHRAEVRLESAA